MSSKQLGSILSSVPSATAKGQTLISQEKIDNKKTSIPSLTLEYSRIVASIPQTLKDEIRQYLKSNKGETETTIVLRALKKLGFNVDPSWIVDKRSMR